MQTTFLSKTFKHLKHDVNVAKRKLITHLQRLFQCSDLTKPAIFSSTWLCLKPPPTLSTTLSTTLSAPTTTTTTALLIFCENQIVFVSVNNTWQLSGPSGIQPANLSSSLILLCSSSTLAFFFFLRACCRFLGVPPGRGSCPLTGPLPFDLIYTDYHGMQQMKQHMGLSLKKHK